MKLNRIHVAALLALVTINCSDNTTLRTPVLSQVSIPITAATGGEVILGEAKLTIAPGALDDDTVITLAMRQPTDSDTHAVVKGSIFDFGPNGLQFNQPAILELGVEPNGFSEPGAVSKFNPNLGLWDEHGPSGSLHNPNLGLWDQTGDSGENYNPNLGLWDAEDPNKIISGVPGFSSYATTRPGHGVYSCGVDDIGSPCCWGLRVSSCTDCAPAADPIPTSSEFIAVAAGAWSDCGLKGDGSIECWGSNPPVPPTDTGFVEIAMGRGHACALKGDGTIACFMADGRTYDVPNPSESDYVAVTAGDFHACGLEASGAITCWGVARDGEADAPSGAGFVSVDAGSRHTCAVDSNGALQCWGSDISGIKDTPSPTTFVQVSVGVFAACALTDVGGVICWGADTDVVTGTPSQTGYTKVMARHRHACAVRGDGTIDCWGQDIQGSLDPPTGCGIPVRTLECEIGFVPDGTTCIDLDECQAPGACGMNATCTNTMGSYDCECDSGFTGDGLACMPISVDAIGLLATGHLHNCAIRSGAIWCWGENDYGQFGNGSLDPSPVPVQVGTAIDWTQIAAGGDHTCAINAGGELWCWGANFGGELGNGTMDEVLSPTRESTTATNWAQVSAGLTHTCAVKTNGQLFCWGDGISGQLGDGTIRMQRMNPTRESTAATNWASVKAGGDHTCALDVMGTLSCWGANFVGQLGNGTFGQETPDPTQIGGTWDKVALGGSHTCATRSGELHCWGSDISGQLGIGGGGEDDTADPTRVGTDTDWATPIAGGDNTCGLKTSGALWCWGNNFEGQLGVGDTNDRNFPTPVGVIGDWTTVELPVIGMQACGLRETGEVLCWGANFAGQLGVESSRLMPGGEIDANATWTSVSAFGGEDVPFNLGISSYGCGIKNDAPWCWGWATYAAWSDTASEVPGTIGDSDWTTISASSTHSCGLQNGAPRCWGNNADGGLGDATNNASGSPVVVQTTTTDTDWTAVSTGSGFTCGIKTGALWCWGRGLEGQLGDGLSTSVNAPIESGSATGTTWTVVSTAHAHACGIENNELYCWGGNAMGQLGNGSTTAEPTMPAMPTNVGTNFISVAAGQEHSCAINAAGGLLCTGDNTNGELGDGTLNQSLSLVAVVGAQVWSSVSVGRDHTCGIAGGDVYCWGANMYGQLGDGTLTGSTTPVAVTTAFNDWEEVSAGDVFTCGRRAGGEAYCWGDNGQGQMGDGSLRFLTPQSIALP